MTSQIDMATALEICLTADQEAKFQALKNLQSKKIKYLMGSIDAKDKELSKLKVLGKDNRRTQMIQALRNKLRDQELVSDVVKEELSRKGEMTSEEVNAYIMRKTLGGPKRFRPLTREELENKINELEKKIKRIGGIDNNASKSVINNQAVATTSATSSNRKSSINYTSASSTSDDLNTIAKLADEVQNLRILLDAKDATIEQQKEDVSRLRVRNSELRVSDEELDNQDRNYRELTVSHERVSEDLKEYSQKLSSCMEENILLKGELASETESNQLELDGLQDQCEKLLRQNSILLKNMATMENDLEKALYDLTSAGSANATASAGDTARTAAIFALESKLSRIAEKLKLSEDENKNLNVENLKINVLKDSLREKNNSIQELKRNFDDREKNKNIDGGLSKDKSSDDLRLKIVDYMEENKTLKRALAAATMGHRTPSVDRIAK